MEHPGADERGIQEAPILANPVLCVEAVDERILQVIEDVHRGSLVDVAVSVASVGERARVPLP